MSDSVVDYWIEHVKSLSEPTSDSVVPQTRSMDSVSEHTFHGAQVVSHSFGGASGSHFASTDIEPDYVQSRGQDNGRAQDQLPRPYDAPFQAPECISPETVVGRAATAALVGVLVVITLTLIAPPFVYQHKSDDEMELPRISTHRLLACGGISTIVMYSIMAYASDGN